MNTIKLVLCFCFLFHPAVFSMEESDTILDIEWLIKEHDEQFIDLFVKSYDHHGDLIDAVKCHDNDLVNNHIDNLCSEQIEVVKDLCVICSIYKNYDLMVACLNKILSFIEGDYLPLLETLVKISMNIDNEQLSDAVSKLDEEDSKSKKIKGIIQMFLCGCNTSNLKSRGLIKRNTVNISTYSNNSKSPTLSRKFNSAGSLGVKRDFEDELEFGAGQAKAIKYGMKIKNSKSKFFQIYYTIKLIRIIRKHKIKVQPPSSRSRRF